MSRTHPRIDICDLWARQDLYGLGPGVYPKAKCLKAPQHPRCRCVCAPRLDIPASAKARLNPDASKSYLRSLDESDAAKVMGSKARRDAVLRGANPLDVWNSNTDPMYRVRLVGDVARGGGIGVGGVAMDTPHRSPWSGDETVDIVAPPAVTKAHPDYNAAKKGDPEAAVRLVSFFMNDEWLMRHADKIMEQSPFLIGVHAIEGERSVSLNRIGAIMDAWLSAHTGLPLARGIAQINQVGHTGSSGWNRLARQALFDGDVVPGANYWLLDDFIGQGGTLANLRGHIISGGGKVVGYTALTGRADSAILGLTTATLMALRDKHGQLEEWWKIQFGFGFEALTESEAKYLLRAEDADTIRNKIIEARSG